RSAFFHASGPTATYTLSLHDALPISVVEERVRVSVDPQRRASHRVLHIQNEPGVGAMAHEGRSDRKRVRREVGDDDRFTREGRRSEEHTSELQSRVDLVCRLLLENKK